VIKPEAQPPVMISRIPFPEKVPTLDYPRYHETSSDFMKACSYRRKKWRD
jgi:hypothetical protein